MTVDVVNAQNEKVGSLDLRDEVFGGRIKTDLIHESVVRANAAERRGTHATKNRAAVSGSGMASTQSLYGFFHAPAIALELDPVAVGSMVSLGAAAGRTMSPVAAVTLMSATLTGTNPFTLAKRVAVPLLVGIAVVLILRILGVL